MTDWGIAIMGRKVAIRAMCAVCSTSLAGKRAGATTCSATCRSALRRRRAAPVVEALPAVTPRTDGLVIPPRLAWHNISGPEYEEDEDG